MVSLAPWLCVKHRAAATYQGNHHGSSTGRRAAGARESKRAEYRTICRGQVQHNQLHSEAKPGSGGESQAA